MATRTTKLVVGAALALTGGLVAIGGGVLMAVVGSDSAFTTGRESISTTTHALVGKVDDIEGMNDFSDLLGRPSIRIDAQSPTTLFVGVGRAADVDRYLAGVAVDVVDDIEVDPFQLDIHHRNGAVVPSAPADQDFWVGHASSLQPGLKWNMHNGDYRVVIMNADSSTGVHFDARFTLKIPHLFGISIGLLSGGALVMLAGGFVLVRGLRTPRGPTYGSAGSPTALAVG
jgi:hypothetical protein